MTEWQEPAIILEVAAYGEGDALVTVLTQGAGAWRGLVKGGSSRRQAALWQRGNIIAARWVARLAEQLGSLSGELVHPAASRAMPERLHLAVLESACAIAAGALPEREPHAGCFAGLTRLLAGIDIDGLAVPALIEWEAALLGELGFGLDLSGSAIAGDNDRLAFVSPRTGRAVSLSGAGLWADRLLRLPAFLLDGGGSDFPDWIDGLKLTGHFLARDAFGARHLPLPAARLRLYDLVIAMGGA